MKNFTLIIIVVLAILCLAPCAAKEIYAELDGYECAEKWQVKITGHKPISGDVFFAFDNGDTETVPCVGCKCITTSHPDVGVESIMAVVRAGQSGTFELEKGFCTPTAIALMDFSVRSGGSWLGVIVCSTILLFVLWWYFLRKDK